MTKAAQSVYYFGFYLLVVGLTLIFTPNILLEMFGLDTTSEVWIRVVGSLAFLLGIYYIRVAPTENQTFLQTTVYNRILVFGWFAFFILMGWVKWPLILFGVVDLLGAAWTWFSINRK
ncbi:MAG TPA: hypothetical protein DCF33_12150 [Saprospirales bacterium]|nr:hypothetical protein [Saprospirales bacterium]